ncbi:MAG: histidinol-phosphatase [Candidatus Zixiibacteriota bacterium]|nr:MAG: histidinol-phosphatase [candidate division Zixibacteria bacterium]
MARKVGDHYQYSGAVHVHTTVSDGTKTLDEVIAIGQSAGLDFLMLSDHMDLAGREAGGEGKYGKMLVLIGYEHNDEDDIHHYLIFGSPGVYPREMSAKEYVAAAAVDGALGIIAHPDEIRPKEGRHPPYPWLDWSVEGYDGIEIWNQMSEWMEKLTAWNKVPMAFSPRKSMAGPTARLLKIWDEVSMTRKVVGVVAVDAHAFAIGVGPLTVQIFPYKVHFRTLRTHVMLPERLSDDFEIARDQVYAALRDCRAFGSNMRWGSADGFQFTAENSSEKAISGGSVSDVQNTRLWVDLPSRALVRIVGNGSTLLQTESESVDYAVTQAGIYRVEAWKGKRGWIFSNHIRVGI